jgi:hypothetical protein
LLLCGQAKAQTVSSTPSISFTQGAACASNGALGYNGNSFVSCNSGAWAVQPVTIGTASSPPQTCSSTYEGMLYFDTGTNSVKYCNGSSWVLTSSGGGSGSVISGTQYQLGYYATTGTATSGDANITTDASNDLLVPGGTLSIGTTTVTSNAINLTGQNAQTIDVVRETTASTAGNNLTVQAGGAYSGATDTSGGNLILSSGISTGTHTSNVLVDVYPAVTSTGSGDNAQTTALTISETGTVTGGTGSYGNLATTLQSTTASGTDKNGGTLTLASGVSTGTGSSSMNFNVYGAAGSTSSTANAATRAMTIVSTGYVGIGTASPAAALDVYGGIDISGINGIYFPTDSTATGASIAIGPSALSQQNSLASTAFRNTAIGYQVMSSASMTTAAVRNVAIGYQALKPNTSGTGNVAVGYQAANANTSGFWNTAVGSQALLVATGGQADTALGTNAMGNAAGGQYNAATGYSALYSTNAAGNTATGYQALENTNSSSATGNTVMGYQAGYDVSSGAENIIIGYYPTTGVGVTTGGGNIMIGYDVRPASQTASNQLNIGNLIYATSMGTGSTISTGSVGIGTTSPSNSLTSTTVLVLASAPPPAY